MCVRSRALQLFCSSDGYYSACRCCNLVRDAGAWLEAIERLIAHISLRPIVERKCEGVSRRAWVGVLTAGSRGLHGIMQRRLGTRHVRVYAE